MQLNIKYYNITVNYPIISRFSQFTVEDKEMSCIKKCFHWRKRSENGTNDNDNEWKF